MLTGAAVSDPSMALRSNFVPFLTVKFPTTKDKIGVPYSKRKSVMTYAISSSGLDLSNRRLDAVRAIQECLRNSNCLSETNLHKTVPSVGSKIRGKVRDIYSAGDYLILVTTDRQSAFDRILASVPFKGQVLNQTSLWWFDKTKDITPKCVQFLGGVLPAYSTSYRSYFWVAFLSICWNKTVITQMGFCSSVQFTIPLSVSMASEWIDAARNSRLPVFSAFTSHRYAILQKTRFWELQRNTFDGQLSVPCLTVQCYRRHQQDPEAQQNITSSLFGKASFSTLTALALGLLWPSDSLAEACTDNSGSIFNMPLLFGIALIGAAVGGALARQRRVELERLNNQLRQINTALKRQVRIESYAPSLSYAPVGRSPDTETTVDTRRDQLISKLKEGKKYLRLQDPQKAFGEFKEAFELAQSIGDPTEAKKAARGMGASCQRQGKFREAIKYHSIVLSISEQEQEHGGAIDAYGAIADCYTELGDLETAAKYYDMYIERLETD